MTHLRILVVEDSLTVRKHLCDVLRMDPDLEIVGEAKDGRQAIELCRELRPDVMTMDMILPVMSGLAATEYIMAYFPTPILVVSSSFNRGELFKTYDALVAGAVDVLDKPREDESDLVWAQRFLAAVKLVARVRVITHPRARMGALGQPRPERLQAGVNASSGERRLVAIGASTGGPAAIVEVLRALPRGFPLPVLLVIHIGEPFGAAFVAWLDGQSGLRVAYAEEGQSLASARGTVVMAPPDRHLVLSAGRFHLTIGAKKHSCRPSVDVLFESLAREQGNAVAACLLTGMGRDGAAGLLEVRRAGGLTIAQDEATSVVFGMPREAALLGAAERVLPLGEIGPAFAALAWKGAEQRP